MKGWTGGQYSLWRIALAVYLGSHEPLMALLCLPLALGWRARIWWAVLGAYWAIGFWWVPHGGMLMAGLIAAQLFVPAEPYLSLSRRGQVDPGTDWRMPGIAFVIALLAPLLETLRDVPIPHTDLLPAAIIFSLLFVVPPALVIPPRRSPALDTIFYDGHCALCHGFIRFLLAEDQSGTRFHFAPLPASESAGSIVVKTGAGLDLVRYRAVQYLLGRLGGYWRLAGIGMGVLPAAVGDKLYDFIASRRYRIFGTKQEVCPLMPPALRPRFDVN